MIKRRALVVCIFFVAMHARDPHDAYQEILRHNYETAAQIYQEYVPQNPHNVQLLYNLAFTYKKLNKIDQALSLLHTIAKLSHEKPSQLKRALSHAYLSLGDYHNGWPLYEFRWVNPPAYNEHFKQYIEHGGSLDQKTVLIRTEYGLGDTLHFIRYAQLLKNRGARIIVESQKQLVSLLKLCPYIDTVVSAGSNLPPYDFELLLMSLPYLFKTDAHTIPATIPYLYADEQLVKEWRGQIDQTTFNVGICWQADVHKNSTHEIVKLDSQEKSIALSVLAELATIPNLKLYSLQKENGLEQLNQSSAKVHDFGERLDTVHGPFMDTAAIIQSLDLVITIDTSIAHLAGGLGVPTWVLLPHAADWRWLLNRTDSPWYPTMRLFRQPRTGDWQTVIAQVRHHLTSLVRAKKIATYPHDPSFLINNAQRAIDEDRLEDAACFLEQYVNDHPHDIKTRYNLAYVYSRSNKPAQACEHYRPSLGNTDNTGSMAHLGYAKCLLACGDFTQGFKEFEWRFPNPQQYDELYHYTSLAPADFKGKKVLLLNEWGLGDMMQFIRYAALVKKNGAAEIMVYTFPTLVPLFKLCPYIDRVFTTGDAFPQADLCVPVMSLPLIFKTEINSIPAEIPYLFADQKLVTTWAQKLAHDRNYKIGLCWRAKKIFLEDHIHTRRSLPLAAFKELGSLPGITWYSLQKGEGAEEIASVRDVLNLTTFDTDFDESHGSFMDTAALIMNLDLVITADTSIVHLAGALGKPVWVLLPYAAEWRWLPTQAQYATTSPWYPNTMQLFRQVEPGNWHTVINEVKVALKKNVNHA